MIKKLKENAAIFGLIFTIVSAVFIIALSVPFFTEARLKDCLFDAGVDSVGALFCAALFFGCMKQNGNGISYLRSLIVLVSACFAVNEAMYYTLAVPEQSTICFVFCLISKLLDLAMIYLFYSYVKVTLGFEGKLAKLAEKIIPVLLALETLILLTNIFYPTTFYLDADGMYQTTAFSFAEDIYLAVTSVLAAILIIMSHNPRNQKAAALTFILFPLIEYALMGGQFGNAAQYGTVLMSLIIMYCVIFIDKSKTLASTQTDLRIASKIQADALPPVAPEFEDFPELILRGSMNTAKEVGGDFYDYFPIDENRICFLIADVSGKGTPAALFMMTAKTMIKDYALTKDTTSEIFTAVNARLCENNDEGMFATAWIGILDTRTMMLQYTNAGHNYPIIQRKGQPCEQIAKVHGLFLAGMEFTRYKQGEIKLEPGDRLLLYTDGVTEAHNRANELYGIDRLEKILGHTKDASGEEALERILADINVFAEGVPQFDDITMVVLTIKEHETKI
ncbi:MAG: serine/threonine-protein phosphatase [Clostridia bacterium]|nr:serine/threonine-protein phosphatase [Clostridia bacterium]